MINFSSRAYLRDFINKKWLKPIESGSEGLFYYSQIDKMGYKIFFPNDEEYVRPFYEPSDIIKNDMVNIDSFIFPETLLVVNGNLAGYITKYIDNNLFDTSMLNFFQEGKIDYKALKSAYKIFRSDVHKISKKHIKIYDLPNNLLFDGERLYAIDTCAYHYDDSPQLLQANLDSLESAMDIIFDILCIMTSNYIESREAKGMTILQYIDYLEKRIKKYLKEEVKQKKIEW